jgi:hypothetical protein
MKSLTEIYAYAYAYDYLDEELRDAWRDQLRRRIAAEDLALPDWSTGKACADCESLLANGTYPEDLTEEETETYLANVDASEIPSRSTSLGLLRSEHNYDCPTSWGDTTAEEATGECAYGCEREDFSSSKCDVCGTHLAGYRAAITSWSPFPANYRPKRSVRRTSELPSVGALRSPRRPHTSA